MQLSVVSTVLALATAAMAGNCKVRLNTVHTQGVGNPSGTTFSNYQYGIKFTYADGRTDAYTPPSAPPYGGDCFASELPYTVCVTSNQRLTDGYMDYGAQHADFNSGSCSKDSTVNPFTAAHSVECNFNC